MFLRRWGARQLLLAWIGYWAALFLIWAGPAVWEVIRLHLTQEHGEVSLAFTGDAFQGALLLLGPPLGLAAAWLAARPSRRPSSPRELQEGTFPPEHIETRTPAGTVGTEDHRSRSTRR